MSLLRRGSLLALMTLVSLIGCVGPQAVPELVVILSPEIGYVPYETTITCFAPPGQFTFQLPDGTVGPQPEGTLVATVDRANWSVVVRWTDGETTLSRAVSAGMTNSPPRITGVIINGKNDLWYLKRMERTLLQAVVQYMGEYRVVEYAVRGSLSPTPYSIFYPPYEPGVCQAYWKGWIIENACIVYPVYASIEGESLPYSPTGLDAGYPTSYRHTNAIVDRWPGYDQEHGSSLQVPEQTGTIVVTVEDEFGRRVSQAFTVPIHAYTLQRPP